MNTCIHFSNASPELVLVALGPSTTRLCISLAGRFYRPREARSRAASTPAFCFDFSPPRKKLNAASPSNRLGSLRQQSSTHSKSDTLASISRSGCQCLEVWTDGQSLVGWRTEAADVLGGRDFSASSALLPLPSNCRYRSHYRHSTHHPARPSPISHRLCWFSSHGSSRAACKRAIDFRQALLSIYITRLDRRLVGAPFGAFGRVDSR